MGVERRTVGRKKWRYIVEIVVLEFRKMNGEAGKKVTDKQSMRKNSSDTEKGSGYVGKDREEEKLVRLDILYC